MTSEVSLARVMAAAPSSTPSPKLVKATRDFEAILLSSWLEKLEESYAGTIDETDPAHGTLASMGAEAMASALAARGGIGVSRLLLQHLGGTTSGSESPLTRATSMATLPPTAGGKTTLKFP